MRKWWRDTRFQEFWRDVGAIIMALAIFTVPLAVTFNLMAGGWIWEAKLLKEQADEVYVVLEKQAAHAEYIMKSSQNNEAYMKERVEYSEKMLSKLLAVTEEIRQALKEIKAGYYVTP